MTATFFQLDKNVVVTTRSNKSLASDITIGIYVSGTFWNWWKRTLQHDHSEEGASILHTFDGNNRNQYRRPNMILSIHTASRNLVIMLKKEIRKV